MHKSNEFIWVSLNDRWFFFQCFLSLPGLGFVAFTLNNYFFPGTPSSGSQNHLWAINSPHGAQRILSEVEDVEYGEQKLSPWLWYFIGWCTNGWFDWWKMMQVSSVQIKRMRHAWGRKSHRWDREFRGHYVGGQWTIASSGNTLKFIIYHCRQIWWTLHTCIGQLGSSWFLNISCRIVSLSVLFTH